VAENTDNEKKNHSAHFLIRIITTIYSINKCMLVFGIMKDTKKTQKKTKKRHSVKKNNLPYKPFLPWLQLCSTSYRRFRYFSTSLVGINQIMMGPVDLELRVMHVRRFRYRPPRGDGASTSACTPWGPCPKARRPVR
jgi:hypothetical protein